MSLNTWKEEFYPRNASDFNGNSSLTELDAVKHSLLKWKGLRKENLDNHGITNIRKSVSRAIGCDGSLYQLKIDSDSCSLCQRNHMISEVECEGCALAIVRGGFPCDEIMEDESFSPYVEFRDKNNPEPMIFWLEKALQYAEDKSTKG